MDYNEKVLDMDVRLLNVLDSRFNELYELSSSIVKIIQGGEKDMEYILHRSISPNETKLVNIALDLNAYLYKYKSNQWEGIIDSDRKEKLKRERNKVIIHQIAQEENLKNKLFVVEEDGDYDTKSNTLYHGTDARIVEMTERERQDYKHLCMIAIDYMWPIYQTYYNQDCQINMLKELLGFWEDGTLYYNLQDALTRNHARLIGNQLYQYDCFYLTTLRGRAKDYAFTAFAGGEIGLTAYRMYEAAQKIKFENWNPSEEVVSALQKIQAFAEGEKKPVVFAFDDLDYKYLKEEDGSELRLRNGKLPQNVRYTQKIELDINKAVEVKLEKMKTIRK